MYRKKGQRPRSRAILFQRLFVLVLLAALFVHRIGATWPHQAVLWLRRLGGKLGRHSDLDGLYVLLAGIRAVLTTLAMGNHRPYLLLLDIPDDILSPSS